MENGLYYDPNAFIKRRVEKEKPKVDLMHIEKVIYPINYENFPSHYEHLECKPKKEEQCCNRPNFDISKLMPLFAGGNLNNLLPNLLSNLGLNNDILKLLNNFNGPKQVKAEVVENVDTISKYKKVEEKK